MNVAMLLAVIYLAVTAGGNAAEDAYKALAVVGAWVVAGAIWFAVNTRRQGHAVLVHGAS